MAVDRGELLKDRCRARGDRVASGERGEQPSDLFRDVGWLFWAIAREVDVVRSCESRAGRDSSVCVICV